MMSQQPTIMHMVRPDSPSFFDDDDGMLTVLVRAGVFFLPCLRVHTFIPPYCEAVGCVVTVRAVNVRTSPRL